MDTDFKTTVNQTACKPEYGSEMILSLVTFFVFEDDKECLINSYELLLLYPVLEVCQFARDASVAEAWLIAQEPYVASKDLGHTVDEVEKLLKRHEAFEKSTATWEERFSALERLTTV